MHAGGWFPMGWMWLFWLVALIACVVLVARVFESYTRPRDSGESPEETLRKRYARGEISKEVFERTLEDLRQSSSPSKGA